ncbi:hypothetical protein TanjilG_25313 [Lupinus angustifolius]|uniref:RIN4 pathogenic type III effector avirulence factor Avr cleavage site domain-containing protein n=1 Tax=Lupinus angustifolius TaxID=3871 RepID=A0A4P1RUZ1_LUPAN|nr:hypothetical protein TanjilG_25313 [Lupinus angustifolius]
MQKRSHVPKFGNWEGEDVPYTAYFDKARQGRTGTKMINPNDPEENPDLTIDSEDLPAKGSVRSANELHKIKEDGDPKNFTDSPARHYNAGNRSSGNGSHGVGSADNQRRPLRQSIGSEYSVERSPLHRQTKTSGKDSPSLEVKNSYDSSHGAPGRSRLKSVNRGDETPDKGAAVPKFGEWDMNNPASADGFTHIFNQVREERQGGAGNIPGTYNGRPHAIRKHPTHDKTQCSCFAWGKK